MIDAHSRLSRRSVLLVTCTALLLFGTVVPALSLYVSAGTVGVGNGPTAVAVNPLSHRVHVADYYGSTLSVLDGVAGSRIASIRTGTSLTVPNAVVVDALSSPARSFTGNFWTGTVTVVDEESLSVTATVGSLTHAGGPRALALDAGAATPKLYVAEYGMGLVRVIDATTYATIASIQTGRGTRALALFSSIPRTRVYAANRFANTVSVIDGTTDQVVSTVAVPAPRAIAVDPTTGWAYVTSESGASVTVIDDTDAVRATIPVGARPTGLAVDPATGRVFVANNGSGTVSVIRTSDLTVEANLAVGSQPWAVAFDAGDGKAFVTCYGADRVAVIDSLLGVRQVPVGDGPYGVAVDESLTPHRVYVANHLSSTVSILEDDGLAMLPSAGSVAYAAAAAPVIATLGDVTVSPDGLVTLSGTARSARRFAAAIRHLEVSVDGSPIWVPAALQPVTGEADVSWTVQLGGLAEGAHSVAVRVVDQTSAASSSSDSGAGAQATSSESVLVQPITVASALQPKKGAACVKCHGGEKPGRRKNPPPDALDFCPQSR